MISIGFETRHEFQLCHFLTVQPWTTHLTFLSCFMYKMCMHKELLSITCTCKNTQHSSTQLNNNSQCPLKSSSVYYLPHVASSDSSNVFCFPYIFLPRPVVISLKQSFLSFPSAALLTAKSQHLAEIIWSDQIPSKFIGLETF